MEKEQLQSTKQNKLLYISLGIVAVLIIGAVMTTTDRKNAQHENVNITATEQIPVQSNTIPQNNNKSTVFSLVPVSGTSPVRKSVGETVSFDIMINPGNNLVTFAKIELMYDEAKLKPVTNAFKPGTVLNSILEGPVYSPGKVSVTLSTGPNPESAVNQLSKAGTISFKALTPTDVNTPTSITFGSQSTALSVATQDNASDNVISSLEPAQVIIE